MPRPATGQVIERVTRSGLTSYSLRFRAYGQRRFLHLGYSPSWTGKRAEDELANVLADVRRGTWRPPEDLEPEPAAEVPTFHVFASEWVAARELDGLRPRTLEYLKWALTDHLLPYFADTHVNAITIASVDGYRQAKVRESQRRQRAIAAGRPLRDDNDRVLVPLSPSSINKTIDVLCSVLEVAVEYGHLARNPAKGRRRRLAVPTASRSYLSDAEQISALLDAAGELDRRALVRKGQRRALLAVLAFAGLRIGEALDLRWGDVNLADGKLKVRASKTAAGVRVVNVLPVLRDELTGYRARLTDVDRGTLVFATSTGRRQSETNVRRRILAPAARIANDQLAAAELEPLPDPLTPHSLRRTYASVLAALGEPMPSVIRQLGHRDPSLTLRIYAHDAARGDAERERLRALIEGREWASTGTDTTRRPSPEPVQTRP